MPAETASKTAGISDEAVKAKTGKTWGQWCKVLDKAGCRKMVHKDIARYVHDNFPGVGGWWSQMVTVGYEQARGLRDAHQTTKGYQVSVSRTISAPLSRLFAAWKDKRQRARWLSKPDFTVRKATPNKSMRITWVDGKTGVDVHFYAKGNGKSQVTVQHTKLSGSKDVARYRTFWSKELDRLKNTIAS